MSCVLTLIVKPGDENTLASSVSVAENLLRSVGTLTGMPHTLGPSEAVDLPFVPHKAFSLKDISGQIRDGLSGLNVDACVQNITDRRKSLLLADMDSTMIENECIDELADYAGVKSEVANITEQAMRGLLDFEASLRARVKLLAGLSEDVLEACLRTRISLRQGAKTLIQTAKTHKMRCVLVSGGFTFFTGHIADTLGFDRHVANRLEIENGVLTGNIIPPVSGPDTKLSVLEAECVSLGITPSEAIAIGDGANDIPMLKAAGLGVAVHAKPKTAQSADIALKYGELHSVLYLIGLSSHQFARP